MTERAATTAVRPPVPGFRPPAALAPAKAPLTPKEVLAIFRRHVLLVILFTVLGCGVGAGIWHLLRRVLPSYTAQAYVEVLSPVQEDPTIIMTPQVQKDVRYNARVSIASLIREQGSLEQLLKRDKVRQTRWFTHEVDGDIPTAVLDLMKHLGAYAQRDADFVMISMTCGVAREAADIVNEMATLFVGSQGVQKRTEIQDTLTQLETRRKQVQAELDTANDSLDRVRTKWGITDVGSQSGAYMNQHPVVVKFNQLQMQEEELIQAISQMESTTASLEALATGPINEQIERVIERDPVLLGLTEQIAGSEALLSGKLAKFGEQHREVQRAREQIKDLQARRDRRKQEIADQTRQANLKDAQQALVAMKERLATIQSQRQEAEAKKKDLDMARVEYERVLSVRDERIKTLNTLKEQIEKRRIMLDDPKTPKVVIKALALPPLEMNASRHWLLWLPLGTVLGFLAGVSLAFAIELLSDRLRTPNDVARFLDVPLLGMIPDEAEQDLPRDVDLCRVVQHAPDSILSESYRRLRANLELHEPKSLLVTGGDAGDGTTSTVANLAIALAANGKKILIVDANFRHPNCHTIFPKVTANGQSKYGLSNALMSQCTIRQAVRRTHIQGLDVMESGLLPTNPADLLATPKMKALLTELCKVYHHVLIDSPPVLLVSDAKVLAQVTEATVVVFNAVYTRRGAAMRTLGEVRAVRGNVVGCVLFGVRAIQGGYYRRQYKSYRRYLRPREA